MPILSCQVDVFPPDLLDLEPAADCGDPWWVLYTMLRREKDLMRRLHAAEVPFLRRHWSSSGNVRRGAESANRICRCFRVMCFCTATTTAVGLH